MLQEEHSAILLTFIKLPFVIKIFVLSIFEWPLKTGFTVLYGIFFRLMLHGKHWCPGLKELVSAKRECYNVATCLDVAPVTGPDATKERFMKDITQASVVHIGE